MFRFESSCTTAKAGKRSLGPWKGIGKVGKPALSWPKGDTTFKLLSMPKVAQKALLLIAMMLSIYGGDRAVAYLFREQTLAPVLAILCFGILIFLGSPRLILVAIPLFAVESLWLIHGLSAYPHVRTISVILGGVISFWACVQKKNLEARLAELDLILEKLQAPWILCDRSGNVLRVSAAAGNLAKASGEQLRGLSFFSVFSAGASKGELIQNFLKAADSRTPVEKYFLTPTKEPGPAVETSFIPVVTRDGPSILVIFAQNHSRS